MHFGFFRPQSVKRFPTGAQWPGQCAVPSAIMAVGADPDTPKA
ncbi:hypothetical protein [Roseicitreum antarcticum]|nr:hypothetical protein [Roseicitreum antarcticum]